MFRNGMKTATFVPCLLSCDGAPPAGKGRWRIAFGGARRRSFDRVTSTQVAPLGWRWAIIELFQKAVEREMSRITASRDTPVSHQSCAITSQTTGVENFRGHHRKRAATLGGFGGGIAGGRRPTWLRLCCGQIASMRARRSGDMIAPETPLCDTPARTLLNVGGCERGLGGFREDKRHECRSLSLRGLRCSLRPIKPLAACRTSPDSTAGLRRRAKLHRGE